MADAYLLSVCRITNPGEKLKEYIAGSAALLAEAGGRYVLRGPPVANYEGDGFAGKVVVLAKFSSMEALKGFVEGERYQREIKPLREGTGIYDIAAWEEAPG